MKHVLLNYIKHCRQFVWNIHLKMRVERQIYHEANPSATPVHLSKDSHREPYSFIQAKWQRFKSLIAII